MLLLSLSQAREMEWVVKIVLKQMKMGLNFSRVLPFFHKDAMRHFEGCHDLKQVCDDLQAPGWSFAPDIRPVQPKADPFRVSVCAARSLKHHGSIPAHCIAAVRAL